MKFRLEYKTLSDCIGSVSRAVATKTANPALGNIHITVSENKVRFVGSDQTIMMISTVPAEVEAGGVFTVPAKKIQELITNMSADNSSLVTLEIQEETNGVMSISCERLHYDIPVQGVEEYPPVPVIEEITNSVTLEKEPFLKAIKEASIAMNVDSQTSGDIQKGICFDCVDESAMMISTDSKRLAITKVVGLSMPEELRKQFVIPDRAIPEIIKLFDSSDEVKLAIYGTQLLFSNSKDQFITRLLEGKFPEYKRIIPKDSNRTLKIARKDLTKAFKRLAPIARDINGQILFDVSAIETKIWADARDKGKAEDFIPSVLEGDPINTSYNIKFLQDFVNVIEDEEVIIEMTSPGYPGVMRVGNPESEFRYIVMPMNRM